MLVHAWNCSLNLVSIPENIGTCLKLLTKSCFNSRECWYMLESQKLEQTEERKHFESGVRMGVGTFNLVSTEYLISFVQFYFTSTWMSYKMTIIILNKCIIIIKILNFSLIFLCSQMISQLPAKILKLLEFVGFSGNKVSVYLLLYCADIKALHWNIFVTFRHATWTILWCH